MTVKFGKEAKEGGIVRALGWQAEGGIVGGFLIAVALVLILMFFLFPREVGEPSVGQILAIDLTPGKGPRRTAVVRVDGGTVRVPIYRERDCRVGQRIALVRERSLIGPSYRPVDTPQPCLS